MTTVDSQTVVSLDTQDLVFSATKDNDDAQVGSLTVTSEEPELPLNDSDLLVYFRKGDGRRPVSGGLKASQTTKPNTTNSSSRNNASAQRPVAANPPKTSQSTPKDGKKK